MNDAEDFLASQIDKLRFTPKDLEAFLAQPVPRTIPDPLKHHEAIGNQIGVVLAIFGPIAVGCIVGSMFFADFFGVFGFLILMFGAVVSAAVVVAALYRLGNQRSVLCDGKRTTGRFTYVEDVRPENLRSAASHTPVRERDKSGVIKFAFNANYQRVEVKQIVPWPYLLLAASYRDRKQDVEILYHDENPSYARWTGELIFPCPGLP